MTAAARSLPYPALSEPADKFKGTYKGKKMRVIKYTADFFYNKVDMIASIPEEDILDSLKNIENLRYTVEGLTFLLSLILSILFSINLYSPIQKLVRTLRGSQTQEAASHDGNEFHYLDREINRMMSNVHSLNEALSYTLPLANERFFVKMLKNNYPYDDESIGAFLKNSNFTFENDHFMIALIQIHFRKPFYDTFTERFQNEASQKIVTVMKTFMPPQCPGYFLEIDSHLFCLLINLPAQSDRTAYEEYCEEMVGLFKNDEHLLRICAGIGGIHQGYKGMQESYIEAMKALWRVSPFDGKRVYAYTESDQVPARYLLSKHDENKLFNLLMSGKQEDVYELLKRVIDANIGQGIPDSMIRELYMHFYIVGLQVLKQKDRSLDDSVSKEYVSFIMSGESLSVDEITQYIFSFFENIMFACSNAEKKFDVTAFKKFIDEHYAEDIHLEYLAQKYNTSAKYMSRLLKNELGIGFQEYLQQLRVGKAKELLRHSDKPIAQIWEEVGFNNRNTFIRAFKNQEGITPSDYRKNIRA